MSDCSALASRYLRERYVPEGPGDMCQPAFYGMISASLDGRKSSRTMRPKFVSALP